MLYPLSGIPALPNCQQIYPSSTSESTFIRHPSFTFRQPVLSQVELPAEKPSPFHSYTLSPGLAKRPDYAVAPFLASAGFASVNSQIFPGVQRRASLPKSPLLLCHSFTLSLFHPYTPLPGLIISAF
jgi:hypothetical protein